MAVKAKYDNSHKGRLRGELLWTEACALIEEGHLWKGIRFVQNIKNDNFIRIALH